MAKLRRRINKQSSKLVKLIIACKRHKIPKHLITEWHMRKYRFKKDWWYIRGDLINESFNIKTKKKLIVSIKDFQIVKRNWVWLKQNGLDIMDIKEDFIFKRLIK